MLLGELLKRISTPHVFADRENMNTRLALSRQTNFFVLFSCTAYARDNARYFLGGMGNKQHEDNSR
jgi:hypothetical protein